MPSYNTLPTNTLSIKTKDLSSEKQMNFLHEISPCSSPYRIVPVSTSRAQVPIIVWNFKRQYRWGVTLMYKICSCGSSNIPMKLKKSHILDLKDSTILWSWEPVNRQSCADPDAKRTAVRGIECGFGDKNLNLAYEIIRESSTWYFPMIHLRKLRRIDYCYLCSQHIRKN